MTGPIGIAAVLLASVGSAAELPDAPGPDALRPDALRPDALRGVAEWPASPHLLVDQFGYLPDAPKVAVLVDPVRGRNAEAEYEPPAELFLVRLPDTVVGAFPPVPWNGGAVDPGSGDRGWWVDFSAIDAEGDYVLADARSRQTTGAFRIAAGVYGPVLRDAVRVFFYQRSGCAKRPPHAEAPWTDEAAYLGPGQDTEARRCDARDDPATARDLRGGWFDAGDTNKYVTFSRNAVHELLTAYTDAPGLFGDDFGLPESGNGVPDLLDEVRWNIDWVRRMQEPDGSVLQKMGEVDYDGPMPPSSDRRLRYYNRACSSATICHAGMVAHAAVVWRTVPAWRSEADAMVREAERSWRHFHSHPLSAECDDGTVKAGDADLTLDEQAQEAVVAAVRLYVATGDDRYAAYVREHWRQTRHTRDHGWLRWGVYGVDAAEALLAFARLPGPDVGSVRAAVRDVRRRALDGDAFRVVPGRDLYRARLENPHWGSNKQRAETAASALELAALLASEDAAASAAVRAAGLGQLHYLHGVNPMGLCYLTNTGRHGAERCAMQMYHTWFRHGSPLDGNPPPGYLVGGPNPHYTGTLRWIAAEPPEKAYFDFNESWPEASWEITENSNTYQASYVKALARALAPPHPPAAHPPAARPADARPSR